jgi:hypothetical protein
MSTIGLSTFAPRNRGVLPGFGLSLGFTIFYLSVIVLIPLLALVLRPMSLGLEGFWGAISTPRVLASLRLSFGMAALAALIDSVFGFVIAWVLVRYRFPGKGLLDALIDLPFALPTAVAGIALSTLYAPNGWIGSILITHGIRIAYTPWGVLVAMTFIGLPFTVRTVQPVYELSRHRHDPRMNGELAAWLCHGPASHLVPGPGAPHGCEAIWLPLRAGPPPTCLRYPPSLLVAATARPPRRAVAAAALLRPG